MTDEPKKQTIFRQKAEKIIAAENGRIDELATDDLRAYARELRVRQVELELQNKELNHALERLQASRAEYFDLFHFAPIGYIVVNEDGAIQKANLAFTQMVGLDLIDFLGKSLDRLITEDSQQSYANWFKRLAKTESGKALEIRLQKNLQAGVWVRLAAARSAQYSDEFSDIATRYFRISLTDISDLHAND